MDALAHNLAGIEHLRQARAEQVARLGDIAEDAVPAGHLFLDDGQHLIEQGVTLELNECAQDAV